jgi:hypothetical protein
MGTTWNIGSGVVNREPRRTEMLRASEGLDGADHRRTLHRHRTSACVCRTPLVRIVASMLTAAAMRARPMPHASGSIASKVEARVVLALPRGRRRPTRPCAAVRHSGVRDYFHNCFDASRAPSAIALNLAQVISGSTWWTDRAKVAKPQSVPAITRSRPTISA